MSRNYYVYIITNKTQGVLYIGYTSNLSKRIWEHKNNLADGFSYRYKLHKLVYYEVCEESLSALERERQLKNWHREWKINLVEKMNPNWDDLSYLI